MTTITKPLFELIKPDDATHDAKALLKNAQAKLGMIPNMYAYMANFPPLLDAYSHGYELFRNESELTQSEQEVVFLAISYQNECDYCLAAHTFVTDKMSKIPTEITQALRSGKKLDDPRLEALSAMTQALVKKRGNADEAEIRAFLAAGFTNTHILALVLAVGVKTLSNYANHIIDTPIDDAFASPSPT